MLVKKICEIVKECGEIILSAKRDSMEIDSKQGAGNFVTVYDKKVQDTLFEKLKKILPDAVFIGEEGASEKLPEKGYAFIIDPIDGTANFIKDRHASSISVALLKDGEPFIGVVYDPYFKELFYAEKGKGAFLNQTPIKVSDDDLSDGLVLFGTSPYYRELTEATFKKAYELFEKAADLRRSGSAALDLCSLAAGRAEVFFEMRLSPWDYAAASLIVSEAGGIISDIDGNPLRFDIPCSVYAKNK